MAATRLVWWLFLGACWSGCDSVFGGNYVPDAFVCTKPGPDELDEDGDCIDDAVDNCPGTSNLDQRDREEVDYGAAADGVGDACDPHPTLAGDVLVEFDGFDDPAASQIAWQDADIPASWMYQPGAIAHGDLTSAGSYLMRVDPVVDSPELVVEIAFEFHAWETIGLDVYPRVRLVIDDDPATPQRGLYCAVEAERDGGRRDELVLGDSAPNPFGGIGGATRSNIPVLKGTHAMRLRIHREADLLACVAVVDGVATAIPVHERLPAISWPTTRSIGFHANRVDLRLDWVAIYSAPASPSKQPRGELPTRATMARPQQQRTDEQRQ